MVLGGGEQAVLLSTEDRPVPSHFSGRRMDNGWGNVVWRGRTDTQSTKAGLGKTPITLDTFKCGWINLWVGGHSSLFLPLCRKWGMHGREASPGTGGWGLRALRLFQDGQEQIQAPCWARAGLIAGVYRNMSWWGL